MIDIPSETDAAGVVTHYQDAFLSVFEEETDAAQEEGGPSEESFEYDADQYWRLLMLATAAMTVFFVLIMVLICCCNFDKEIGRNASLRNHTSKKRGKVIRQMEESQGEFVYRRRNFMQGLRSKRLDQTTATIFKDNRFGIV